MLQFTTIFLGVKSVLPMLNMDTRFQTSYPLFFFFKLYSHLIELMITQQAMNKRYQYRIPRGSPRKMRLKGIIGASSKRNNRRGQWNISIRRLHLFLTDLLESDEGKEQ
jgi:hypothetical protein